MHEQVITKDVIANPKSRYGNGQVSTRQFKLQRLTGALNVLFIGLLLYIVVRLAGTDRANLVATIGSPWIGLPFAVLFAIVCVHMRIGMLEIIEDYLSGARANSTGIKVNTAFCVLVAVVGVFSILKLMIWG